VLDLEYIDFGACENDSNKRDRKINLFDHRCVFSLFLSLYFVKLAFATNKTVVGSLLLAGCFENMIQVWDLKVVFTFVFFFF
jgi:hypothetical protein